MDDRNRKPFDLDAYIHDIQTKPCFICEIVSGNPEYPHHIVYEDDIAIAFLNKYPTLYGYTLVAPKMHREQVTGDFTAEEYLALQQVIYRVTEAVRLETEAERTSTYSRSAASRETNTSTGTSRRCRPACRSRNSSLAALGIEKGILDHPRQRDEGSRRTPRSADSRQPALSPSIWDAPGGKRPSVTPRAPSATGSGQLIFELQREAQECPDENDPSKDGDALQRRLKGNRSE